MAITATEVNKLRQITGAGMMDCKKALEQSGGDFEAAIDHLRKKGQKVAANRAEREAKEGVVIARTDAHHRRGIILRLTSETDFVAKNADFVKFAGQVADAAMEAFPADVEALKKLSIGHTTVADALDEQVAKIGEKIEIGDYQQIEAPAVVAYNHAGNKVGVLLGLNKNGSENTLLAGRDAAMQVAAMRPVAVDKEDVSSDILNRELDIAREQVRAEGKSEDMVEKIAQGKLNKFFKESTLLNQEFVKDPKKTVKQMLQSIAPDLTVTGFKRVAVGE